MIKKISHIGLAVEDVEKAGSFFSKALGHGVSEKEGFGELRFSFLDFQDTTIELLQSTTPQGEIAKFLQKRGQGVHHISFEVDHIQEELDRLKAMGVALIHEKPYLNAHKDLVAFLHPKSTFGVLVELIQKKES
jgi:methylmalonyl-CoA/ethylmalonyl-CoA epimerase